MRRRHTARACAAWLCVAAVCGATPVMAQEALTAVPDAEDGKKQVTELSKSARVCFSRGSLSQANQATLAAAESSGQLAGFSINPQGELEPIQAASDNWFSKRRLKAELKKRANAGQAVQLMSSLCGNEIAVTTPESADPTQLSKVGGSGSPGATSTVAGAGGAGGAATAASTSGLLVTGGLVGVGVLGVVVIGSALDDDSGSTVSTTD